MMKKSLFYSIFFFVIVSLLVTSCKTSVNSQSIFLTVNNENVSGGYFLKRVVANPSGDIASTIQLLEVELIVKQRAAADGVAPVIEQDIDGYLRNESQGTNATITDAQFNKWLDEQLKNTGLSLKEYREVIGREIQRQRLTDILSANIPTSMAQVHLWAIPFNSNSAALAAKIRIDNGTDFAIVANTIAGQTNGGDQGWLPLSVLPSALNTAASTLEVGKCSDPVAYTQSNSSSSSGTTSYVLLLISEKSDSMSVTPSQLAVLKNNNLNNWLNLQLQSTTITLHNRNGTPVNGLTGTLDNETLTWLNNQVKQLLNNLPSTETTATPTTTGQ